jgi:hypothetical protein
MGEHILLLTLAWGMPFLVIAFSKKAIFQRSTKHISAAKTIDNVIELKVLKKAE